MEIRLVTRVRGRHRSHDARRDNAALLQSPRRHVKFIENLVTGERHVIESGGVRLRIDQQQDPALLSRCLT